MSNNQIVVNPSTSGIQVSIDFQFSSEHKKLLTKFRENLKLPERPLDLNTLFNAKLVALLTEDDEMLNPIVKALQKKVENINANSRYLHQFSKDLQESDGLLYMDGKLVIPFTLRNAVLKTLHESHPGQFGMKYLAQYIWWPHINRQIYFHGINCTQCTKTDKGKSILSRERALDWNADDRIEDGYRDLLVPKKNQSPLEKGYDSDLPTTSKPSSSRVALNSPFKVSPRKTNKAKTQQTRKPDTMTGRHTESFTPVTTRSRGTRQPTKFNKPKRNRNKASTSNTGYLAGDESMFIPSDTSDISDWEWIAGGFPCREMIRKRFISYNLNFNENPSPPLAPQTYQTNIKSEILDKQLQPTDTAECPISIKPAPQSTSDTPGESSTATTTEGPNIPSDSTKALEGENPVEFPVFEIEDSSNESANSEERHPKEITTTGNEFKLRRSSRNVGPPQFYGKRYYIDIIDECENQPGSANNPISLDEGDSSGFPTLTFRENPSENQTHICGTLPEDRAPGPAYPSSPDQFSIASTDESLRDAVNNFDNYIDLDSEFLTLS